MHNCLSPNLLQHTHTKRELPIQTHDSSLPPPSLTQTAMSKRQKQEQLSPSGVTPPLANEATNYHSLIAQVQPQQQPQQQQHAQRQSVLPVGYVVGTPKFAKPLPQPWVMGHRRDSHNKVEWSIISPKGIAFKTFKTAWQSEEGIAAAAAAATAIDGEEKKDEEEEKEEEEKLATEEDEEEEEENQPPLKKRKVNTLPSNPRDWVGGLGNLSDFAVLFQYSGWDSFFEYTIADLIDFDIPRPAAVALQKMTKALREG
jgi:hypothetical protein